MEKQKFSDYGMFEGHPEYELAVQRCEDIYQRRYDLRSDFARDYIQNYLFTSVSSFKT